MTIRDVARRADVSFKTVSRVLNGISSVHPDLKARVERSILELGFRPNRAARMLSGGPSSTIGLIMIASENSQLQPYGRMPSFIADVISALIMECRERSYHLMVHALADGRENFAAELDELMDAVPLDGAVLLPPSCDYAWLLDELQERKIRFARILPGTHAPGGMSFTTDNFAAGEEIAELILDGGHSAIGMIRGPDDHVAAAGRARGFRRRVLADEHATLVELPGDFLFGSGFERGLEFLRMEECPTAIFAANDEMAAGVLAAANSLGLSVPEQISIVGYGDLAIATRTWPQLTTISQNILEMAKLAAGELIQSIARSEPENATITIPHELKMRSSFAPKR